MKRLAEMCIPNIGEISVFGVISMIGSVIALQITNELIHIGGVMLAALLGAIVHHLARYYMSKKFPLKK